MDIVKLSTGVTSYPDTEVTKSNVIPIRPSKAERSAEVTSGAGPEDRFTRSPDAAGMADGVTDTVTLSGVADPVPEASSRDARVAGVIEAVQNGSYKVDSSAVADAMVSTMANRPGGSAGE